MTGHGQLQGQHPRTALVTGAARRIGRSIAIGLAKDGWAVAIHYNGSGDDAAALCDQIRSAGGRATAIQGDLADSGALASIVETCCTELAPPTCLINNASLFEFDEPSRITLESWTRHQSVNLTAPVLLAQAVAEHLASEQTGNIINLIDQRVLRPTPEFFSYAISKAALWHATRMLAQAYAPKIRVNAIGPGPVLANIHQSAEDFAAEAESTLLGRQTEPEEIVAAVRFIIDAPAMTGQMIALDGGQHLNWTSELGLAEQTPSS